MIHHITLLVATIISFIKYNKKAFVPVSFAILFVFSAIRYGYGNDYFPYMEIFEEIKIFGTHAHVSNEFLYILLNRIMPSFQVLIAVISFFYLLAAYKLITKNLSAEYQGLAVLIFLLNPRIFIISLSAIRQSVAITLFVLAVYFALKKKPILYMIIIIMASMFHVSAIFLLPMYFIANEKKVGNTYIIVFVSLLAGLLLSSGLLNWVLSLLEGFLSSHTHYMHFLDGETNTLRATLLSSLYLIYLLLNVKKLEGKTLAFTKLYMVAMFIAIMAFRIPLFTRFQQYFDIFSIVSLPGIIAYNYKNENRRFARLVYVYAFPLLLLAIYILRYYSFFQNDWAEAFRTYKTILPMIFG